MKPRVTSRARARTRIRTRTRTLPYHTRNPLRAAALRIARSTLRENQSLFRLAIDNNTHDTARHGTSIRYFRAKVTAVTGPRQKPAQCYNPQRACIGRAFSDEPSAPDHEFRQGNAQDRVPNGRAGGAGGDARAAERATTATEWGIHPAGG